MKDITEVSETPIARETQKQACCFNERFSTAFISITAYAIFARGCPSSCVKALRL